MKSFPLALQEFPFDKTEFQLRRCMVPDCARGCFLTPWCHTHLASIHGVTIWRSVIPGAGAGLFTLRDIPADSIIGQYDGLKVTVADFESREKIRKKNYAIQNGKEITIAQRARHGYCRYINDLYDEQKTVLDYNSEFIHDGEKIIVKAKKLIEAGSEIFINYKCSAGRV